MTTTTTSTTTTTTTIPTTTPRAATPTRMPDSQVSARRLRRRGGGGGFPGVLVVGLLAVVATHSWERTSTTTMTMTTTTTVAAWDSSSSSSRSAYHRQRRQGKGRFSATTTTATTTTTKAMRVHPLSFSSHPLYDDDDHCPSYGMSHSYPSNRKRSFGGLVLHASSSDDHDPNGENPTKDASDGTTKKKKKDASTDATRKKERPTTPPYPPKTVSAAMMTKEEKEQEKARKKQEIIKQVRSRLRDSKVGSGGGGGVKDATPPTNKKKEGSSGGGLLEKLNPFQAGQSLRQTLGTLTSIGAGLDQETRQKYYLDDRFLETSGGILSERNPFLERQENNKYAPEVLVVGATGEIGRMVVRRLLLDGRFRVRVLVRDLYSQTLNLLGTGVTYCQGDLSNMESLEYAVTDVDKIVFCAAAPRPDEPDFQQKFQYFLKENLQQDVDETVTSVKEVEKEKETKNAMEWEQLSSILELRAQLAEQVDLVGMQNLVRAYQNVRHADYGTSQAAKRGVFKFSSRPEDFGLFSLDHDTLNLMANRKEGHQQQEGDDEVDDAEEDMADLVIQDSDDDDDDNEGDPYAEYDYSQYEDDEFEDEEYYEKVEARRDTTVRSQIQWIRNEFGHGVFVGKVPKTDSTGMGGEASVISSRLRSREDAENGIDLSGGFAGFIVRLVGDGGNYEAFVRTGEFERTGIEYVCPFSTATKPTTKERKSRNKFITVRLPFENFKPVLRQMTADTSPTVPPFQGNDVRNLGFRFRSAGNPERNRFQTGENLRFYMALSYVKVYRLQPEPEFVYLSDARIPPVVKNGMVLHDQRRLLLNSDASGDDPVDDFVQILDDNMFQNVVTMERSPEEIYFRFRGEEVLKSSGLSYTIVRVAGYNESPSGEASSIDLMKTNHVVSPVSRADAAQVCVSALLDPEALNKSVYIGKRIGTTARDEDISAKFAALPSDST